MSVSIADLKLPTEGKNSRLNIIPYYTIIPQGRTVKPSVERQKKHRREFTFFCAFSRSPLSRHPCGDLFIALSGQKFLRIVKGLFSKSPLTGVWGGAPPVNGVRGGAPYNTCRCGARGSAPYILIGVRGGSPHTSGLVRFNQPS